MDYNPSYIDKKETILGQLITIKKMLKTYPSQQYFATKVNLGNEETNSMLLSNIYNDGRQVNVNDFIYGKNEEDYLSIGQITAVDETYAYYRYVNATTLKPYVTAEVLFEKIKGSESIVVDINEDNKALEIHLDYELIGKIDRAILTPLSRPSTPSVPVVEQTGDVSYRPYNTAELVQGKSIYYQSSSESTAQTISNLNKANIIVPTGWEVKIGDMIILKNARIYRVTSVASTTVSCVYEFTLPSKKLEWVEQSELTTEERRNALEVALQGRYTAVSNYYSWCTFKNVNTTNSGNVRVCGNVPDTLIEELSNTDDFMCAYHTLEFNISNNEYEISYYISNIVDRNYNSEFEIYEPKIMYLVYRS